MVLNDKRTRAELRCVRSITVSTSALNKLLNMCARLILYTQTTHVKVNNSHINLSNLAALTATDNLSTVVARALFNIERSIVNTAMVLTKTSRSSAVVQYYMMRYGAGVAHIH